MLEPVERWVDRALGEVKCSVGSFTETLHQRVAMSRLSGERGQQEQVEMSLQYLGSQSYASLGISMPAVKP